jgi:PAS domain S-box-containing protein
MGWDANLLSPRNIQQKAIFDVVTDPIWLKDRDGRFLAVNAAWCRFCGMEAADVVGKTGFELFSEELAIYFREQDRRVIESRKPMYIEDMQISHDGRELWFETIKSPLFNEAGEVVGTSGLARDITERKRTEQELRDKLESERRLLHAQKLESFSILATGFAHDFNNILAGIMGYADLALAGLSPIEPVRRHIEVIKEVTQRAADLTRQVLACAGRGTFVIEPVDLSQLVEDSRTMLDTSVPKHVSLAYDLASHLPVIHADAAQICQVVMNLVINAFEALGDKPGEITVSTSAARCETKDLAGIGSGQKLPDGLYVALEVADTGCGMNQETMAKIFDPFFTTKFVGRGLGLAAVQGIVRSHKGAIQVSSKPGEGTKFRILFPADEERMKDEG